MLQVARLWSMEFLSTPTEENGRSRSGRRNSRSNIIGQVSLLLHISQDFDDFFFPDKTQWQGSAGINRSVPVAAVMEGEATIAGRKEQMKIEIDYADFVEVEITSQWLCSSILFSAVSSSGVLSSKVWSLVLWQRHEWQGWKNIWMLNILISTTNISGSWNSSRDLLHRGDSSAVGWWRGATNQCCHAKKCLVKFKTNLFHTDFNVYSRLDHNRELTRTDYKPIDTSNTDPFDGKKGFVSQISDVNTGEQYNKA